MRVSTIMGEAFVSMCAKEGGDKSNNWVARQVADKAIHTQAGTKAIKPINVHCSKKTRDTIARDKGVDVWS